REFFDTYSKLLFRVATKSGLQNADAEDLVQDVIVAVKDAMPDFNYDPALGSFKGWLLTIARRRIIDHVRKQQREPQRDYHPTTETARTPTVHRIPDPKGNDFDRLWNEEWEKSIFEAALQRVKQRLSEREFQIFDCYALQQWPVKEVAETLDVKEAY